MSVTFMDSMSMFIVQTLGLQLMRRERPLLIWLRNPGRFGPGSFRPGSFRPGSFRPNLGVGRFGLSRWVDLALGRFGPASFRSKIDR